MTRYPISSVLVNNVYVICAGLSAFAFENMSGANDEDERDEACSQITTPKTPIQLTSSTPGSGNAL